MDVNLVAERLKAQVTAFKFIGVSADIPSAGEALRFAPSAFVIPLTEEPTPNSMTVGAITQLVTVRFGVILAVRNVADAVGAASLTTLEPMRKSVKAALLGWQPAPEFEQVTLGPSNIIKLDNDAILWWLDTFETNYLERVT